MADSITIGDCCSYNIWYDDADAEALEEGTPALEQPDYDGVLTSSGTIMATGIAAASELTITTETEWVDLDISSAITFSVGSDGEVEFSIDENNQFQVEYRNSTPSEAVKVFVEYLKEQWLEQCSCPTIQLIPCEDPIQQLIEQPTLTPKGGQDMYLNTSFILAVVVITIVTVKVIIPRLTIKWIVKKAYYLTKWVAKSAYSMVINPIKSAIRDAYMEWRDQDKK